jgi:hypothetical protein
MLIASFSRLSQQATGFNAQRVWVGNVGLPARSIRSESRERFMQRILEELRNSPGVESVSVSDSVPLTGNNSSGPYARIDNNPPPLNQRPLGLTRGVSPGYFGTMGIPLLAGRDFNERDGYEKPNVAILSSSTAKKLFGNEDPVGRQLLMSSQNSAETPTEIVGVSVTCVRSSSRRRPRSNSTGRSRSAARRSSPSRSRRRRNLKRPPASSRSAEPRRQDPADHPTEHHGRHHCRFVRPAALDDEPARRLRRDRARARGRRDLRRGRLHR